MTEPQRPAYEHLIDYAVHHCEGLSLIIDSESALESVGKQVLSRLEPNLLVCVKTSLWPLKGWGPEGLVYVYRCTPTVGRILKEATTRLFAWRRPTYPENLSFYHDTEGHKPWLVTIAHERQAYFRVTPGELLTMKSKLPWLRLEASFYDPGFSLENYASILRQMGQEEEARRYEARAKELRTPRSST